MSDFLNVWELQREKIQQNLCLFLQQPRFFSYIFFHFYGFLIDKFENHADLFSNFNDVLHFIMKEKKKN